jgi:hypothetical protein
LPYPSKDLCAINIVTPCIGCDSDDKVATRVKLGSPAFYRENRAILPKIKKRPEHCSGRLGSPPPELPRTNWILEEQSRYVNVTSVTERRACS